MATQHDLDVTFREMGSESKSRLLLYIEQSEVRMGSGQLAEQRVLESLALAYSFRLVAN